MIFALLLGAIEIRKDCNTIERELKNSRKSI
jgi:hypothetical protein